MTAKTALFGGTFDPIHTAHIEIAKAAVARLAMKRVLFVPAANPPHKLEMPMADYDDRVRMVELACAGHPAFEVSRIEEGSERSYSIVTIEKLLAEGFGPLAFLIGADAFAEIRTWHRWEEVVRQVEFVVVSRPHARYSIPPHARVRELTGLSLPESSSDVRKRLANGSCDVPVPAPVLDYIRSHGLYRSHLLKKSPTPSNPET